MARRNSNAPTQSTIARVITVHSKTYREHSRGARGSKTPATLNESLQDSCNEMVRGNKPARLIKDAIDPYREDFKGGQLWQRLVGIFKKQAKEGRPFSAIKLKGLEINEKYPLSPFFLGAFSVLDRTRAGLLEFEIDIPCYPKFKVMYPDGFRIGLVAIFLNFEADEAETSVAFSYIISRDTTREKLLFSFAIPPFAEQYIACMKLEGTRAGEVLSEPTTKGMRIVAAGDLKKV